MLNEVLISGVKLARDYDQCKMQAHSAYMQGNEEQASSLYHVAFGINKALMSHYPIASVSLIRCVHACLDCLDFCNRISTCQYSFHLFMNQNFSCTLPGLHRCVISFFVALQVPNHYWPDEFCCVVPPDHPRGIS